MTHEATDTVLYEDRLCPVHECPLDAHENASDWKKKLVISATSNRRGHTARWAIQDRWLCLTAIEGFVKANDQTRPTELSDLLPGRPRPTVAAWFTGTLNLGDGHVFGPEHEHGLAIHERTIRLAFQWGRLQSTEVITNSTNHPYSKWPARKWFPETADGHNAYMDAWTASRKRTPLISGTPMEMINEHRAAVALASTKGWKDKEE